MTGTPDYRSVSLWLDTLDEAIVPRRALRDELTADVVIVGAGFIGLWTAYCLAVADPALDIVVLEAEVAGFGAAGRTRGSRRRAPPARPRHTWRGVAGTASGAANGR
jgi:choline dehydrogenase-like flavoprotein